MLDETSFHTKVDEVFLEIEDRVDELVEDIDIASSDSVLTFTLANGSSVILSRQISTREIWIAAKIGGFHLRFCNDKWVCDATGERLYALLDRIFIEQGARPPFS